MNNNRKLRETPENYKIKSCRGILKPYDKFMGKITLEEFNKFKEAIPKIDNFIIYGNADTLNKAGMHIINLWSGCSREPLKYTFEQLAEGLFSKKYEISSGFSNPLHPLLLIYVNLNTSHLGNDKHMTSVFHNRYANGNKTIVLCELRNALPFVRTIPFMKAIDLFEDSPNTVRNEDMSLETKEVSLETRTTSTQGDGFVHDA